ncbi:MAG: sodium:alanine symporter family protein, partial [Fibrobacter sp.]|nr:sodium:alanine symporter family protein [Fibrobacter sp.]
MAELQQIVVFLNAHLSDYVLTFLLVSCGIYFTFRTRFVQVRCFAEGWRNILSKNSGNTGFSSFQALATAIAAQVGTGNIVGASGAILTGGPGAIFWMWIIAFFGMATIYAEAVLAIRTREILPDKTICGGPVYYIKKAFPNLFGKFLMIFFAIA